ncbi:MAG: hypothetical protein AB1806_14520 [Acidobacteriota bacterium]
MTTSQRTLIARAVVLAGLAAGVLAATSRPAAADITAFLGTTTSATGQVHKGLSAGFTILLVGLDFEYAAAAEDPEGAVPSLSMGSANVLVQTPTGRVKLYGTVGIGVYREALGAYSTTNTSANAGGGVKIGLAGPLGLRIDYRAITLRGSRRESTQQRWYVGLNLTF